MSRTYDNFADLITFTRASTATFVGSNGLIQSATTNTPRIDFDPVTGDRKGLLIEEARTNLITKSEVLDANQAGYNGTNLNATDAAIQDGTLAPDGVTQAYFTVENNSFGEHALRAINFTPTVSTVYAMSVFAKVKTDNVRRLAFRGFGAGASNLFPVFDLVNGTVVTEGTGTTWDNVQIEDYGNGWYRCSANVTTNSATEPFLNLLADDATGNTAGYAGDNEGGLYLWGLQVEEGSFPTSYIPTSGATATRSADVASIATSAFGFNEDEGTLFTEARTFVHNNSHRVLSISDGTTSNRIIMQAHTENHLFVGSGGATQAALDAGRYYSNQYSKHSAAYQENNFAACLDGGTVATDSLGTIPTVDIMNIGVGATANFSFLNGHIKKIQYFPRRLSDTELQEITS